MFEYWECLSYSQVYHNDISCSEFYCIVDDDEIKHVTYYDSDTIEYKLDDSFAKLVPVEYSFIDCNTES